MLRYPRPPAELLLPAAALLAAACSPAEPNATDPQQPWDEPVDGAVAVTAWQGDGEPASPFGPGGYPWDSPRQLVDAMAAALASGGDVDATGAIVEHRADGAVVGWVRARLVEPGHEAAIAFDLRLELRRQNDSWSVTVSHSREHCPRPLTAGACQ